MELTEHSTLLLEQNSCKIESITAEWDILKNRLLLSLDTNSKYLDVWLQVFATTNIKSECSNVLHIIELLLIIPYLNDKLERMFSVMGRVKTDWQNQMGRDRLEASLRISEGVPIAKYCPNAAINLWFEAKVRQLNCSSHSYPKQRKATASSSKDIIVLTELTMSDLEAEQEESNDEIPL